MALACIAASTALAQLGGGYLGPAVLSSGAQGVGNRSGQQVDLRFYAGVEGFYDTTVQPAAINSQGQLIVLKAQTGVDANIGLYGTHSWRNAILGIDYRGIFRDYIGASIYDGIDQYLDIGYTLQESRRFTWKAQAVGGIISNALGGIAVEPLVTSTTTPVVPGLELFDSRSYYLQGGLDATYLQSARTSYTVGGQGFDVWRQSSYLVGVEGYNAHGSIEHKLSKYSTVGALYEREHFNFPKVFGQADIDVAQLVYGTTFARLWSLKVRAGIFHSEVKGLQIVTLNPVVAALLGTTQSVQAFYRADIYPSGDIALSRRFKTAILTLQYQQLVTPGNGVYLTSRSNNGVANYSYTGIRKVNLSLGGGYFSLNSLGPGYPPYRTATGGGGITYSLPWQLHIVARYDYRYQEVENAIYKHTGYRASLGLTWSPGKVPLSLW